MKRIAFYNSKGGTGKTTLSGSVANEIVDCRVVLIDFDTQGNLSTWLLEEAKIELADVLYGKQPVRDALVEIRPGLSIIPTFGAGGSLQQFTDTSLTRSPQAIGFLMQDLELFADIVICDLSPSQGLLERYAIAEMDEIFVPVSAEFFGLDGVEIVNAFLSSINQENRTRVKIGALILNMVNRSYSRHLAVCDALTKLDYPLRLVPQDAHLANAQFEHNFIAEYCRAFVPIKELANLITGGLYAPTR